MPTQRKTLLTRFLIWRLKHISHKQFVFIVSILVGFMAGIGAVIIKNLTHFIQTLLEGKLVKDYHAAFYFIFPIIGFTIVYLYIKYVLRNKVNHGIPSTLFAISKKKGIMKRFQMFGSLIAAPITVGFGGSVGLEGPTVATGAAFSSNLSRFLHLNQATRTLLIGCAAAGAMASIFKAPIAAIIFAVEVFSLDLTLASLIPLLLASVSAIITSYFFFGNDILLPFSIEDSFELKDIPFYIILGIVAGFVSIYFTEMYERIQKLFDKIASPIKRLIIGGLGIGILIYFIPPLYGEGFDIMNNLVQGNPEAALQNNFLHLDLSNSWTVIGLLGGLVFFKVIATSLTFGAGGVGGIFAPTLFMGSIMGYTVAKILNQLGLSFNISESNFTLVGMTGVMAGVLHAPLTAIFLIAEVTGGYELFIPLMITAAISFSITKYFHPHSVYTMELGRKGELITHNKDHAVLTLMDIQSVVEQNFISINPEMTLGDIVHKAVVKSNRNIFPVVHPETNTLEGIILLDDLRPVMFDQSLYTEVTARDVMQNPLEIIDLEKDKMTDVMKKFQDSGAWNLPVVSQNCYFGFVSKSKLLTAYRRKLIDFSGK
ncbi:chloride channel protein [Aureisphaera sp. CAU 1614]|uniref:Chloride channel protein n=1 Tax=Halomarinibacterium sedimenti TaxID=2857106 RepID=A0A9X1FQB3_9FLAO|nr:chloride channel protein [Halomarinibacterium sedimenti]MBW2938565.1 chloride channel protein [Halomarinibacterium sedimenti]